MVISALRAFAGQATGSEQCFDQPFDQAANRALMALAAMQCDDGLFGFDQDRTEQDRALVAAFVLYMLSGDCEFRQAIRFADLSRWFEQNHNGLDDATAQLWQLSTVTAGAQARRSAA